MSVEDYVQQGEAMMAAAARQREIMRGKKFDTIAVHGLYSGQTALENQGSIIEPAYFSTAQHFENSDHMEAALAYLMPSWTYSRIANPTVHYLEETLALLEGYGFDGEVAATTTSSGAAAVFMSTNPFLTGDQVNFVASARCYGGTFQLFSERYQGERGIDVRWVPDTLDLDAWSARIDANTRFLYSEMPTNPTLSVFDVAALADLAHSHNIPLIVDSTLATPALMRPLLHGADVVVHSTSKSMTTSGFAIGGAVVARHNITARFAPDEARQNFAMYIKTLPARDFGPSVSPFNALMTLSDLRTLRSKVDTLSQNAMKVARYLDDHPQVESVRYPGLPESPGHEVAAKYMWLVDGEDDYRQPVNRYGHLLSFNVKGGHAAARQVFDRLQLILRATDLGRIKSVATIPVISTHQQQGDEGRDLAGIPTNMIRLNVGGEHPDDVIADLDQALG